MNPAQPHPRSRIRGLNSTWLAAAFLLAGAAHASAQTWLWSTPPRIESTWRAPGYVPDELLVKFKDGVSAARAEGAIRAKGASSRGRITSDGLTWVKLAPGTTVPGAIDDWNALPGVEYAAPNLYVVASFVPNDSVIGQYDLAWNLRNIGAYGAWDIVRGDPRVVLAIIDSGVAFEDHPIPDYELPGIKPGVTMYRRSPDLQGPVLPGYDFVNDDAHPNDDNGHGTMVATIAAGSGDNVAGSAGVAFGISILPIKVLDHHTNGTMAHIVQGIRYAGDQGADLANLSLGFPSLGALRAFGFTPSMLAHTFKPLRDAVFYAQRRGTILVAAAGNFAVGEVSLPAGYPGVISVGATGFDNQRSSYSSYGNGLMFMAPGGDFTELNGDGVQDQIMAMGMKPFRWEGSPANPDSFGVFPFVGTSAASPHVAGAVALLMSLGIKDQGAIEQALRETAIHPFGNANAYDPGYGFGLIQLDKAVKSRAANKSLKFATARPAMNVRSGGANPARESAVISFRTTRSGETRVRLFDVRGALVRTVEQGYFPAGERAVRWDGTDERGERVPSGVYFFRIESPDGAASQRVAVLH